MDDEVVAPTRSAWKRPLIAVALAAFVGVWGWGFWYDANRPKPEPLDATAQNAALAACKTAVVSMKALPQIGMTPTVAGRVALVHDEDAILTRLVADLHAVHPTDGSGAKAIAGFTSDWQDLAANRQKYAAELSATGQRPKLRIPVDPTGAPITIRMREYAEIHKLTDCTPDSLQGEVVEGLRVYPRVP
jgi:hypothetical protein